MVVGAGAVFGVEVAADAVRVVAFGDELAVLETTELRYPRGVLDPYAALDVALAAIERTVLACHAMGIEVHGMCFAGAGETLLALDERDRPLTPVFTGPDAGTSALARRIHQERGEDLHRSTGVPVHAGSPLVRLAWFASHGPDLLASVHRWCELKDFVLSRLTCRVVGDTSCASASGMLDVSSSTWSDTALELAGLEPHRLPELADPNDQLPLSREAAGLLGLQQGLPLVVGAAEGPLSALGMGVTSPGTAAVSLGARPMLSVLGKRPAPDGRHTLFSHRLADGVWSVGGGADGDCSTEVRVDGVGRCLADAMDALLAIGAEITVVRATQSVLRVPMAAEVVAASLNVPVEITAESAPAAVGAALLACRVLGIVPSLHATAGLPRLCRIVLPDPRLTRVRTPTSR